MEKRKTLWIILTILITIGLLIYNAIVINPQEVKVREVNIKTNKISKDNEGLIIAYFSDTHYGEFTNKELLEKAIDNINAYEADIVIFGGDLYDGSISPGDKNYLKDLFKSINAKIGKYAISGENDRHNLDIQELLKNADFRLIDNQISKVYINKNEYINLIGVDENNIDTIFENNNSSIFNLVITHYPDNFDKLNKNNCDYVIAGHSLGGQLYIPIINYFYRPDGAKNYYHGIYNKDGLSLDITNGIGMKENKVRLFADSEVVIYRLTTGS